MQSIVLDGQTIIPSKVVCIGRNYVEHIHELNNEVPSEPVIFVKPNSAVSDQIISSEVTAIHYEAEISLLVKDGKFIAAGIGLDLTKREIQSALKTKGLPWERAKAFNQSAIFSEFVSLQHHELSSLSLTLSINGELTQQADYQLMIYKPEQILANVSEFMDFENNDILMTGTPKGVGKINQGDSFVAQLFAGEELLVSQTWTVK